MSRIGTRAEYHNKIGWGVIGREECPFCDGEKIKNTCMHTFKYWHIVLNKYPYSGQENHLMAVPIRHLQFVGDLNQQEFGELPDIHAYVKEFYEKIGESNYFSATRETMGNRSIEHYHIHFIPGKLQGKFLRAMLENQGYPIDAEVKIQKDTAI